MAAAGRTGPGGGQRPGQGQEAGCCHSAGGAEERRAGDSALSRCPLLPGLQRIIVQGALVASSLCNLRPRKGAREGVGRRRPMRAGRRLPGRLTLLLAGLGTAGDCGACSSRDRGSARAPSTWTLSLCPLGSRAHHAEIPVPGQLGSCPPANLFNSCRVRPEQPSAGPPAPQPIQMRRRGPGQDARRTSPHSFPATRPGTFEGTSLKPKAPPWVTWMAVAQPGFRPRL